MQKIILVMLFLFSNQVYGGDLFNFDKAENSLSSLRDLSLLSDVTSVDFIRKKAKMKNQGYFYDWGEAVNGWGYCYKWTNQGAVLNEGQPVNNYLCEQSNPSLPDWGVAQNGWGYCYRYTPYGHAMNEGQPIPNYLCDNVSPSYYSWGTGHNGNTYCYQYTSYGVGMNKGQPVADYYCQ